jgi:hypothetical protein
MLEDEGRKCRLSDGEALEKVQKSWAFSAGSGKTVRSVCLCDDLYF